MSPAPPCSPVTSRSMLRSSEAGAALGLPEEAGEGGEDGGCLAGAGAGATLWNAETLVSSLAVMGGVLASRGREERRRGGGGGRGRTGEP